jgi:hypothetical protein
MSRTGAQEQRECDRLTDEVTNIIEGLTSYG